MTKEEEEFFNSITLPLFRNNKAESFMKLGEEKEKKKLDYKEIDYIMMKQKNSESFLDKIEPVHPLTLEQAAKGRPIKDFPYKLDDFVSYEALEAFIRGKLRSVITSKDQAEWLDAVHVSSMDFSTDTEYYRPIEMVVVGGTEPFNEQRRTTIPRAYHICKLNMNHWKVKKVKEIINQIKNEYVLQSNTKK